MPSLGSILSIANSALKAQQQALQVTAHNIANASTEGYSRQRAVLAAGPPQVSPEGVFGSGVRVVDVQRVRDFFLDQAVRSETSRAQDHGTRGDILARIETILSEPTEQGPASNLDAFFNAWSELATNPTNATARELVLASGGQVAADFNRMGASLDELRLETESRLQAAVDRINAILTDIASMNREIVAQEASGLTAADTRDARARLVDELGSLVPLQVVQAKDGSIGVIVSGVSVVDQGDARQVETKVVGGVKGIGLTSKPDLFAETGGQTGGMLAALNTDIPDARQSLDDMAAALVAQVNTLHRTGTNPLGTTNVDFFDPAGITATGMRVAITDRDEVSAGVGDGTGAYQAGANDVALGIAQLRDTTVAALSDTFTGALTTLVSDVGQKLRSNSAAAEVHQTLADQAGARRAALSEVSVDEELVQMIQFQTAYAAAARVVSTTDEMLASLLAV
ncbi:MAG: flagellar hook-associated protein FlgK [Gemmatimonadetes bacterium]|nr:MAG: flagellar hook-associated protein FlgK [Gemmatimonadota bacterium]